MSEFDKQIAFRLKWIAELEEKVSAMQDDWSSDTPDAARLGAAVLFPDWSPKLDALRTILELRKFIYTPTSPEVIDDRAAVEEAKKRVAASNIGKIETWPADHLNAATGSFLTVAKEAGLIRQAE